MKLVPVPSTKTWKAPSWLKQDPVSGYYWFDIYRADLSPQRLSRSTGEKESKTRALVIAERAIKVWMGTELTGEARTVLFRELCKEFMEQYQAKLQAKKIRIGTFTQAEIYVAKYLRDEFGEIPFIPTDEDPSARFVAAWKKFVALYQRENPGKKLFNHWKHLSLIMTHAHDTGLIKRPWKVENPDPKTKAGIVLTEAQKTALLEHGTPALRDQLLFAMTMGMRLREHLKLSWDRVDLKAQTVTLRPEDTKTKKGRIVRMSPQVLTMLERRFAKRAEGAAFVFPSRGNAARPVHSNKNSWKTAKIAAGIKGRVRYHDLRHTFLTECAKLVRQGDVSVVLVCAYAGLSIQVFERVYLHLNQEDTEAVSLLIAVKLREESIC